ncbi:hypothetical protein OC842_007769 [Tilletia horrida]|uniref:Phytoene desaturase n=1 Tax=Tilletia horrida TaxID=155126 RepID=A0AAN6G5K3_9BASI|nr:hypothetical protein OC842_007769 [Tilletia horrida]
MLSPSHSRYFKSPQIRQAATFSSMYMGMSPFHSPATYSLLQYAEYAKGIHYPIGGFHAVVAAFEKIARQDFGVDFRYGPEKGAVKRIVVDERRDGGTWVKGVELESGETIEADLVVSNADLVWTYNNLLPPSKYARNLRSLAQTCSSISFYWALSKPLPQLTAHNIFLAPADLYAPSFDDIFQRGQLPTEPSFYVNVPSKLDAGAAPEGKETLVVLVPCGPIEQSREEGKAIPGAARTRTEFSSVRTRARAQVLQTMEDRLGMGRGELEKLIEHEYVHEPLDWAERFNLWRGSILGLSHTLLQVLCLRPSIKHAKYRNLYFVGASTQPGTGVPVVVAGSEVVAKRVDRFLRALDAGKTSDDPPSTLAVLSALVLALSALVLVLALVGFDGIQSGGSDEKRRADQLKAKVKAAADGLRSPHSLRLSHCEAIRSIKPWPVAIAGEDEGQYVVRIHWLLPLPRILLEQRDYNLSPDRTHTSAKAPHSNPPQTLHHPAQD